MRRLHILVPIQPNRPKPALPFAVRLALAIVVVAGLLFIGYVELASTFAG
jgi:hypothetical protein